MAMRARLLVPLLACAALAGPAGAMTPRDVCPQIERRPVAHWAEVPEIVRRFKGGGRMAEGDQNWNSTDVIHANDPRPLAHSIAAGDMGSGRWLVVYETGGRMVFRHVEVWVIGRDHMGNPVAVTTGNWEDACARAAARLGG
jgi:hypothetical protein